MKTGSAFYAPAGYVLLPVLAGPGSFLVFPNVTTESCKSLVDDVAKRFVLESIHFTILSNKTSAPWNRFVTPWTDMFGSILPNKVPEEAAVAALAAALAPAPAKVPEKAGEEAPAPAPADVPEEAAVEAPAATKSEVRESHDGRSRQEAAAAANDSAD